MEERERKKGKKREKHLLVTSFMCLCLDQGLNLQHRYVP